MVNFWNGTSYRYEKIRGVQTNHIWGTQAVSPTPHLSILSKRIITLSYTFTATPRSWARFFLNKGVIHIVKHIVYVSSWINTQQDLHTKEKITKKAKSKKKCFDFKKESLKRFRLICMKKIKHSNVRLFIWRRGANRVPNQSDAHWDRAWLVIVWLAFKKCD